MKSKNLGLLAIIAFFMSPFFFIACEKDTFVTTGEKGDLNLQYEYHEGDVSTTTTTTEGDVITTIYTYDNDTIFTNNGTIITVAPNGTFQIGNNSYYWNSSTNTFVSVHNYHVGDIITVQDSAVYVNGNLSSSYVVYNGEVFNNTGGTIWLGDNNAQYYWDQSQHTFIEIDTTINTHNGDNIVVGPGGLLNTGSGTAIIGNVVYDSHTENITTYSHIYNVQGDFWQGSVYNPITNTTTLQVWENNTWITVTYTQNWMNCCPNPTTCEPDTVWMPGDSSIHYVPNVGVLLPQTHFDFEWWLKLLGLETGVDVMTGNEKLIKTTFRLGGNSPTFAVWGLNPNPVASYYYGKMFCRTTGDTMNYRVAQTSQDGSTLLSQEIGDGAMGPGPLAGQNFDFQVLGVKPAVYEWANNTPLSFVANNHQYIQPCYITRDEQYDQWYTSMGGTPKTDGYLFVLKLAADGTPNQYISWANGAAHVNVADFQP